MGESRPTTDLGTTDPAAFPPGLAPWGIIGGLLIFAIWELTHVGLVGVVRPDPDDLFGLMRANGAAGLLGLAFVWGLVAACPRQGQGTAALLGLRRPDPWRLLRAWWVALLGLGAWICAAVGLAALVEALNAYPDGVPVQPVMEMVREAQSGPALAAAVIASVVVAPVGEEVVFRSVLYQPLRGWLGAVPAAFVVALLFGLMHFYPIGIVNLMVLSLTFTALFERTGTLWAPIVAHACYNGAIIVIARSWPGVH